MRRRAATADHRRTSLPRDEGRRLRRWLLGATILSGAVPLAAQAQTATTLPSGGTVVAGQATIAQVGSALTIHQSGDRAVIDWADFSIGEKASVLINNGSGATLNRVTGGAVSSLDGLLRGTGSVYLVNPNGIVIGAGGVVETSGSFIASTLDVPNAAFMAGGSLTFAGTSRAKVVNLGKVGALGGDVALIGAVVENRGSLSAANGTAGLIAGSKVLLRDGAHDGGGLFSVLYGDAATSAANGGTIAAANAELRAQQGNVYALAGNSAGTINATGVRRGDGKVWLVSTAGATDVAGTIHARGEGGTAGAIETSGARLRIGAASINAAGGTWLLDPEDLVIDEAAASAINGTLAANTGVSLVSGVDDYGHLKDGLGDILINAGLSWNTGAKLTLNAYHGISINADIAVNGGGSVELRTNQGGSGGAVVFAAGRSITFADGYSDQSLGINGAGYTLLHSWSDLQAISGQNGNYALAHDLPPLASGNTVVPTLDGVLDGLGNSIEDLEIRTRNVADVGLIGTITHDSTVRNLVLAKMVVTDWNAHGSSEMGALAGRNQGTVEHVSGDLTAYTGDGNNIGGLVGVNTGDIRNVSVRASAIGNNNVGGLVGQNFGRIQGAQVLSGDGVEGAHFVGGLVGSNAISLDGTLVGSVVDSSSTIPVVATLSRRIEVRQSGLSDHAGGLVGLNSGTITRSFATGDVRGFETVGGLVGENAATGTITNSYATGKAAGDDTRPYGNLTDKNWRAKIGGLVGRNAGTIAQAFATGAVTGSESLGGLVGENASGGTIDRSYATGAVAATVFILASGLPTRTTYTRVGGLVGYNIEGSRITNVYATGSVRAREMAGGLVGENREMISNAYASGSVVITDTNSVMHGGLAGLGGSFKNAFWNKDTSGQSQPAYGSSDGYGAHGLTSSEMISASSFANWDLDSTGGENKIWRIYDGATAPMLKAFLTTANVSLSGSPSVTLVYDGTSQPTAFGTSVAAANGQAVDPAKILGTAAFACSGGDGSCRNVGSYQLTLAGGLYSMQSGYDLVFSKAQASLAITPRALTVTANDRAMTYGESVPTLTYRLGGDGLVGTDTLGGALATSASATSGVGTYGIAQGTLSAGANYALNFTGANLTVTPRALTVSANDRTMVYGDAVPGLTYTVGGAGLVNGDMLGGALATSASATSNVGSYAIGQGSLSASPNYALTFVGGSVSVTPRALTVTANDRTMMYGDSVPALTYALGGAGLVNGDTVNGALATSAGATSAVGSYAIGRGTLTAGANYALSFTGGSLAVTPRPLILTADDRTMVYGGSVPALSYALSGAGLVNGDTLAGALSTTASATSAVGNYAIGLGTLTAGANYALQLTGGSVSVTPRPLAVTANDRTMVYGDGVPTLTYAVTDGSLVNGDTLSGALTTNASASSSVGSYAIGQGTLGAGGNYALNFTGGVLAVTPRALTVTANDRTMVYGNGVPTLTYAVGGAGLVNGDTLAGALATSASATSDVGSYAIGQGTLSGGTNYTLNFTGGSLSVTARPLSVAANDRSMVYGDAVPDLTYTLGGAGLVNGDTLTGALATGANPTSGVGSYAIGQGGLRASSNYALTFTGGTLAVTPRALMVTASDRTMAYGDGIPALTYSVGGAGLVNGDTLSGALTTAATSASGVGSYAIDRGTLAAGANYVLGFTGGSLSITPRALAIAADPRTMLYGDAVPGLTYTIGGGGLVNGDTLNGALATTATATSGVGSYAIGQGTLQASANYALTFTGASLAVAPRTLTVAAGDRSMMYGEAVPTLSYAVDGSGLVNGDTLGGLLRGALSTEASATSPVGSYAIGLGTLSAGANYTLRLTGGSVSITPRPVAVTANDRSMLYGDNVPVLTYTLAGAGLVNGDTLRGALGTAATAASPVGSYGIGLGTLSAGANYALTFTGGTLAVTPRPLIIQAQDSSKVLGTPLDPGATAFQAIGLVNGDRVDGVTLSSEGFAAEAPYQPDPYAIAASNATGTGLSNYVIVYQNAPTGLIVREPDVRPTPVSIRFAGDAPFSGRWAVPYEQAVSARADGPVPLGRWPGIFFKRQN
ncbi:MBG domain-containing protein [Sphingomonas sp.]|uniref:MBG domain-containing protein n=1 Tax=Sphingomonas sp. TaxID=28214 RepID=UPI002FD99CF1